MLLPSLITLRYPESHVLAPEDIYSSALGTVFTDDLQHQHGDGPNTVVVYKNAKHGELEFRTADVNGEEQRRKFAHYLWNAGILMAELVGGRPDEGAEKEENADGWKNGEWWVSKEEETAWGVQGKTVLELGAGVGLGGITSALAGASEVAITDYPAPPLLDTIKVNVAKNVPESIRSRVAVEGHLWGSFSTRFEAAHAQGYTRILAADCLWMPHEHGNLARSMVHFLADSHDARVFCIAGFHTGRAKVAPFFEDAIPQQGLEVEEIYEMNAEGARRTWATEREDMGERKKWLVVARLRKQATKH